MRRLCTTTKSNPHLPQLEKAQTQQQRPTQPKINKINKYIKKKKRDNLKGAWTVCEGDSLAVLGLLLEGRNQLGLSIGTKALVGAILEFSLCLAGAGTGRHPFGPLPLT